MSEWKKYSSGDEQIAEISSSKNGFVCRNNETDSGILTIKYGQLFSDKSEYPILNAMWSGSLKRFVETHKTTHYWIISDDPLREMKIRQAQTGQPVWIKMKSSTYWVIAMRGFDLIYQDHVVSVIKSTTPDWWIPNAEYSFIEFEKSVDK